MRKCFFILLMMISSFAMSQPAPDVASLQETAKNFIMQGDHENAILVLNRALELNPKDLGLQKDLLFAYYLKRDFAKALEIGKPLVERKDADIQLFHMFGLVYKAIADDKEADKLYKKGLKKFPNAGILYSEYGDLLAAKNIAEATKLWEKGIEMEPNHSSNYYYVAQQYANTGEILWSMIYAEIFLNMESLTPRATEIKNILLDQYKKFFLASSTAETYNAKKANDFTKAVAEILNQQRSQTGFGITPESLTVMRTRFVLDWFEKYPENYPFRLFDHQKQLLQEGLFEAYNFWLFGPASNIRTYQAWQKLHQEELDEYLAFARGRIFKIPDGQQYRVF